MHAALWNNKYIHIYANRAPQRPSSMDACISDEQSPSGPPQLTLLIIFYKYIYNAQTSSEPQIREVVLRWAAAELSFSAMMSARLMARCQFRRDEQLPCELRDDDEMMGCASTEIPNRLTERASPSNSTLQYINSHAFLSFQLGKD